MGKYVALLLAGLLAGTSAGARSQTPAAAAHDRAARWWPGFIDTRGKAFLELPDDGKLCALARDAVHKASAAAGRVIALPVKIETLLPRGARLAFGVVDTGNAASERVLTRVVTIARGTDKGACAHLAEAGAEAPGYIAEEDRIAFGVHPPRPPDRALNFRAPLDTWRSHGAAADAAAAATGNGDARFAAAAETPPAWRALVTPLISAPAEIFGQRFAAVLKTGEAAAPLLLTGAIAADANGATYNTVNLIVRDATSEKPFFQAGPSGGIERNRPASFVAQVAGALDLDGDGIDEIVLRARYYSGGNLKILKFSGGKLIEVRQSAYEGE